jgi:hypothetical protein
MDRGRAILSCIVTNDQSYRTEFTIRFPCEPSDEDIIMSTGDQRLLSRCCLLEDTACLLTLIKTYI